MFIALKHKNLHVYGAIRELMKEVYSVSLLLPSEEKYNLVQQLRRAALSVKLNLAEGASRKSVVERNRFLEIARGSVVEIDAALEAAVDLNYLHLTQLHAIGELLNKVFAMLSNMFE
ncbi:MAG: four helix bundle protein [Chitinophagaceae bacterium]|nr:MAG: four helix bundle protein [Chitinophagaceae bacterium]